jgi:hypothetical protein
VKKNSASQEKKRKIKRVKEPKRSKSTIGLALISLDFEGEKSRKRAEKWHMLSP